MNRLHQVCIAVDQLFNALAGGCADETLSARAWRCRNRTPAWAWTRRAIDALFWFDPDHCAGAYIHERMRGHLPEEYR